MCLVRRRIRVADVVLPWDPLAGKRLLKRWLCHPLRHIADINDRLDAVEDLQRTNLINGTYPALLVRVSVSFSPEH